MLSFLKEYIEFLKARKKIILIPFSIILLVLAFIVYTSSSSVVTPFIYTLF